MTPTSRINFILKHGHAEKSKAIKALALSFLQKTLSLLPEFFLALSLDIVTCSYHVPLLTSLGITQAWHQLLFFAGCTLTAWLLTSLVYYFELVAWQQFSQSLQHNLRLYLYEVIFFSDQQTTAQSTIGNRVTAINEDINHIEHFFRFAVHDAVHLMVGTCLIGCLYLWYAPLVACAALSMLPIIILLSRLLQQKLQCNYQALRNQAGTIASTVMTSLHHKDHAEVQLSQESLQYQKIAMATARINALFNPIISMVIMFGIIITLLISGWYVLQGKLSPGVFSIILLQTQRLLWPFARTAHIIDAYEQTMASVARIMNMIHLHAVQRDVQH